MLQKDKGFETLQKAWGFPSRYEAIFLEQLDAKVKRMITEGLGFKNGYGSISCFYRNGKFSIFETGFRLSGGHSFDYQKAYTGRDYLETMINYAINEPISDTQPWTKERKALIYNLYFDCKKGDIMLSLEGIEELKKNSDIITVVQYIEKGFEFNEGPKKILMCTIYSDDLSIIKERISYINNNIRLITNNGIRTVYGKLALNEIEYIWK